MGKAALCKAYASDMTQYVKGFILQFIHFYTFFLTLPCCQKYLLQASKRSSAYLVL